MNENFAVFALFLIFSGAAILSTAALFTRQAMLVAYIVLGMLLGPWGFKIINNIPLITRIGDIGVVFLLFLLGLNLNPNELLGMFKKTFWVTGFTSLVFAAIGFLISFQFGFSVLESIVVGIALMFSSTIISLKLLPIEVLRHERKGELIVGVLLLQDFLALIVLLVVDFAKVNEINFIKIGLSVIALPLLVMFAVLFTRLVIMRLFARFHQMHEYIFLLSIGWCLSFAELCKLFGFSYEIGAFIAGVSIATGPISVFIAESLKPLRDFFLVVFFFAVGADFNMQILPSLMLPVLVMTLVIISLKPWTFKLALKKCGENSQTGWEVGLRLGQASCFSILVAQWAKYDGLIGVRAAQLIQITTTFTFVISSYLVVFLYPTPHALKKSVAEEHNSLPRPQEDQ
jgi:Kef-type K+ transport system membrane component KefB